jgi:hypothetical protein
MKQRALRSIMFAGLMLASSQVWAQDVLVFSAVEKSLPAQSIGEVLRRAYARLGIRIVIRELPGKRGLFYADRGVTDGATFRIRGIENEYPHLLRIDVPLHVDKMYLYVKRGREFRLKGWESLPPKMTVGYQRGVKFAEKLTAMHGIKTEAVDHPEQLLKMLEFGRVDAVIEGTEKVQLVSKKLGFQDIVRLTPPIHTSVLYHYLHEKHAHLAPRITAVLEKMSACGEIETIKEKVKAQ